MLAVCGTKSVRQRGGQSEEEVSQFGVSNRYGEERGRAWMLLGKSVYLALCREQGTRADDEE